MNEQNLRKRVKTAKNCKKKKSDSKIRVSARHSQGRRQRRRRGHYYLFWFIKEIKKIQNRS